MSGRLRRILVAGLAVGMLALEGIAPVSAAAPAAHVGPAATYYGSIAIEPATRAYGWAYNYATKAGAEHAANRECKSVAAHPVNCRPVVWVKNGCAAVNYKHKTTGGWRYSWGIGNTKAQAKANARAALPGSSNLTWVCTTR